MSDLFFDAKCHQICGTFCKESGIGDRAAFREQSLIVEHFREFAQFRVVRGFFHKFRHGADQRMRRIQFKDPFERLGVLVESFHDALLEEFLASGLSPVHAMARLKELWFYMQHVFPGESKAVKAVFKSKTLPDYRSAVAFLFSSCAFDGNSFFSA